MEQLSGIKEYARKNDVPIMMDEGIAFICSYIREHDVKNVLEIGSAIGYSAMCFAGVAPDVTVVTVEIDGERYGKAVDNVSASSVSDRIRLIHGDALKPEIQAAVEAAGREFSCKCADSMGHSDSGSDSPLEQLLQKDGLFDLIFLDAAKSQYINFFDIYRRFLRKSGCIICDNLSFHGMTAGYRPTENYNTVKMLRKIRGFIIFLKASRHFATEFHQVGDGVSVSRFTEEGYEKRLVPSTKSILLNRP